MDLLHLGAGGCFAVSGALVVAAVRTPRTAAPAGAPAGRLHVSAVEEVPVTPGTGVLESVYLHGGYGPADDITHLYCPEELRVTPHVMFADGIPRCWHCPEGDA